MIYNEPNSDHYSITSTEASHFKKIVGNYDDEKSTEIIRHMSHLIQKKCKKFTCCCSFHLKGPSAASVLGTGAKGQVSLLNTVLFGAKAVLFTIATIATKKLHNVNVNYSVRALTGICKHKENKKVAKFVPYNREELMKQKVRRWGMV